MGHFSTQTVFLAIC